jgi:predicted nucleic acid-binding Zn ribbon protein
VNDEEYVDELRPTEAPIRVGELLDRVVRDLGGTGNDVLIEVFGHWDSVAGAELAAVSRPVAIRDDTLSVAVADPLWATELRYRQAQVLDRLADRLGRRAVTRLDVRIDRSG